MKMYWVKYFISCLWGKSMMAWGGRGGSWIWPLWDYRINPMIGLWGDKLTTGKFYYPLFSLLLLSPINHVISHPFIHFFGDSFSTYHIYVNIHQSTVLIPSLNCNLWLTYLTINVEIFFGTIKYGWWIDDHHILLIHP